MNTPASTFILFFSNDCKFCKNLIPKVKSRPALAEKVKFVDIDKIPDLPDEVDEIPCFYDGTNIFKGAAAFKWLEDKSMEFLLPADNSLNYSFLNGEDEQLFNNFSLLEQKNGSFGMGDNVPQNGISESKKTMASLETLMSSRSQEIPLNK
jgi:hypothetical protein